MSDLQYPKNIGEFKVAVDDLINHPDESFFTTAILPMLGTDDWNDIEKRREALSYL